MALMSQNRLGFSLLDKRRQREEREGQSQPEEPRETEEGDAQTEAPERPQSLISSLLRVTGDRERGRRGPEPARGAQEARGGRGSEGSSGEVPESAGIGFLIVFLWFSFQNQYGNQQNTKKTKGGQ